MSWRSNAVVALLGAAGAAAVAALGTSGCGDSGKPSGKPKPAARGPQTTVKPGQSIQRAIDSARPGTTVVVQPGTYRESLVIARGPITIRGPATLLPPPKPPLTPCSGLSERGAATGICVNGGRASNVRISGLTVRGFPGAGILSAFNTGFTADHDHVTDNRGYGIFAVTVRNVTYTSNITERNGDAGLYVGESPSAHATIIGNRTFDNRDPGILVRSANIGAITNNDSHDNCAGILLLGHAPGTVRHFAITRNRTSHNSRQCSREEHDYIPPLAGVGIGLIGTDDTQVTDNDVARNGAARARELSAGILLRGSVKGIPSRGNVIRANRATNNHPWDVSWDGQGSNQVTGNMCSAARPARLCR